MSCQKKFQNKNQNLFQIQNYFNFLQESFVKMLAIFLFIFLMSGSDSVLAQTFTSGTQFYSYFLEGQVDLTCSDGREVQNIVFDCQESSLEPANYTYFVGPVGTIADEVKLVSVASDATSSTKTVEYDNATGMSAEKVNLWISSLFQKPLLKSGVNKIYYFLYQNSKVVNQGKFQVEVISAGSRACSKQKLYSSNISDCGSQYSICQTYFQQNQQCR